MLIYHNSFKKTYSNNSCLRLYKLYSANIIIFEEGMQSLILTFLEPGSDYTFFLVSWSDRRRRGFSSK